MNPEGQPGVTIAGYCRACGKALDASSIRMAQGTIYCAEHVPAAAPPQPPPAEAESPYTMKTPPPIPDPGVSPGVAFVLGLIPGVGAIYNGQYAKGLLHVFILGMLFTLANNNDANGFEAIFGVLIPAFWAYMAFEAYHTARRRLAGQQVDEFSSLMPGKGGPSFPMVPVMMILLGVIFLLNNLEIFQLRRMLKYWPVMLIGLGAYLLYLRVAESSKENDRDRK